MNENDSIGEIELWMNMTELMKMNLQFMMMNYEWQMKWIKKSYWFKLTNRYDEEFSEGFDFRSQSVINLSIFRVLAYS